MLTSTDGSLLCVRCSFASCEPTLRHVVNGGAPIDKGDHGGGDNVVLVTRRYAISFGRGSASRSASRIRRVENHAAVYAQ